MNLAVLKVFTRNFRRSASFDKISTQAKFMTKIIEGNGRKKSHRYYLENRSAPALLEFVGQKPGRNTKEVSRRAAVLNTVFLERITDILSSSKHDHGVHQHGFLVTKVKYANDGSALHVYWCVDSDLNLIEKKLPAIGGWLRHELSQLQNGRVPHINFIYDKSTFRATDVEELLKIADFGPDFVPPHPRTVENGETLATANQTENKESDSLVKSSSILGIDRDAIINRVCRKMNHVPEPTQVEPSYTFTCDPQRRIDFKKYLQEQEILKAKMERRNKRSMLQNVDMASLTGKREDLFDDENMSLEEDYFDDETDDEETSR